MAKLARSIMKVFGDTGGAGEFGQIGSKAAGSPVTTKNLTTMQALTGYLQGLFQITSDQGTSRLPFTEDINSLFYLTTSQLSYLFQNGIPEWLDSADQRYYADVSVVTRSGGIYMAIQGDDGANINSQLDPVTNPLWWTLVWQKPVVEAWDVAEAVAYDTAGVVVERGGQHFTSTGVAGNSGQDPIAPGTEQYWYPSPGIPELIRLAKKGGHVNGDMHPTNNLGGTDYSTSLLLDKASINGTTYEFYRVALDGTQVTGDATLEAIFGIGGTLYNYIDEYAPDNIGTRTLINAAGRSWRSKTTGGGVADTLAEVQEDAMQRITGTATFRSDAGLARTDILAPPDVGVFTKDGSAYANGVSPSTVGTFDGWNFDSSTSVSPNAAKTNDSETRVKAIVHGIDYIIVMKAA